MKEIKKRKVAYIIPYKFIDTQTGGPMGTFSLCQYLGQIQDLYCISTDNNPTTEEINFNLVTLLKDKKTKYLSPKNINKIVSFCKENEIEILLQDQPFFSLLGSKISKKLNIPYFVYEKNVEYQRFKSMKKKWWPLLFQLEKHTFKNADKVLFLSKDDIEIVLKETNITKEKVLYLPHGTDRFELKEFLPKKNDFLYKELNISQEKALLLFYGGMGYYPNYKALEVLIEHIAPLLEKKGIPFHFIICGGGLPEKFNKLKDDEHFSYLGFVKDIEKYVKAVDLMINPVTTGGGVKTKLIESIALNTTVISAHSGALGMNLEVCGEKLFINNDNDWEKMADIIEDKLNKEDKNTPNQYYQHYYWGKIANQLSVYFEESLKTPLES